MLKDKEIKSIIESDPSFKDMALVIQRYIFDKKGQEINISEPVRRISVKYTMMSNRIVTEENLFNLMYNYSKKYYEILFNKNK